MATVALLGSLSLMNVAGASTPTTPADSCARQADDAPTAAFAMAFCTDLVQDLTDIGQLLDMSIIQPTDSVFSTPVKVIFSKTAGPRGVLFDTAPFYATHHAVSGLATLQPCEITAYPSAYIYESPQGGGVSPRLHVLIAHEAVHCYQDVVTNAFKAGLSAHDGFPKWVSEGSATYLATLYARHGEVGTEDYWYGWIENENRSLINRTYDAVGWYSLVAYVNKDPLWSKMAGAWKAYLTGGYSAYIAALGGDSAAVAKAWAPSILNLPPWGDAWATHGVDVATGAQPQIFVGLPPGTDSDQETIQPLAAIVDDESDVDNATIEISVTTGFASVHDLTGYSDMGFTDEVFCLGTACKVPALCPGAKAPLKPIELTKPFTVAAGGGATAATYSITKIATSTTPGTPTALPATAAPCKGPSPSPPKSGSDLGDPHLQALNGGSYDFQGAGEYTLVRSGSGDVDVQVRAAPATNSRGVPSRFAAWNTAVAMRVVSTDVEIDAGNPVIVRINGKSIGLAKLAQRTLDGGGHLAYRSNGPAGDLVVSWPDGSSLDVFADSYAENATFTPPRAGVDNLSGLLSAWWIPKPGAAPSSLTSETLIDGNGHHYVIDPTTTAGFKALYGPFAATWHVTKRTSMFSYPKGKSTSSYDVKGFPKFGIPSDLSPEKEAKVEGICKADRVTDPKLLDDCKFDVAETGQINLGTKTTGGQPATGGNGTQHPASYYFTHPCEVVTPAGIEQALGVPDPGDSSSGSECDILGTGAAVDFSHQSVASFKSHYPGTAGSGPVPSLGHEAYCVVSPGGVASESDVVASLGSAGSLQILADDCTKAIALTKDALSHISGL